MAFTDRFIKLPIEVFHEDRAKLTGKKDFEDSWIMIVPLQIESFRPSHDDDFEINGVSIQMKSGDRFTTSLLMDDFIKLLDQKTE